MQSKNKNNTVFLILGIFISLVLLNLISLKAFSRLDLTRDKKFTLSRASVETVARLEDLMTVTAYFTENLPPPYAQNARYVQDLLAEYLASSKGKFAFEFLDPTRSETEEDKEKKKNVQKDIFGRVVRETTSVEKELSNLGLQPVEIRVIEEDEQQTKRAYMGLVVRYQNKHEVIPVVQNLSDLEKDLTSLMRKLVREKMPIVGVVHDNAGPNINRIKAALSQNVELKDVDLRAQTPIGDEIDALLVIGSGDHFGENGAKKINDYLAKGKSAAIMLDRYSVDPRSFEQVPIGPRSSTHEVYDLLKTYGIEISSSLVADVSCASLNVQEQRGIFSFSMPIKYPFVPELMNLSFESAISKNIAGVILPFTSKIAITQKPGFKSLVIAQSSKMSWQEKEPLNLNPRRNWGEEKIEPDGPYALLAEFRGTLPGSEQKSNENKEENKASESRLFVSGSSAFLWDEFLSPQNQMLGLNIVDWMLADSALLEMRSRNFQDAPIDVDLSDTLRLMIKFGNIFGVPLLLILYGLIRWRLRESKRHNLNIA